MVGMFEASFMVGALEGIFMASIIIAARSDASTS